jgi:hypothetical protein
MILKDRTHIFYAYSSFKWRNLASNNAGVTVIVVGLSDGQEKSARMFSPTTEDEVIEKSVPNINAYMVPGPNIYVEPITAAVPGRQTMFWGNKPTDGGHLVMTPSEARAITRDAPRAAEFLRPYYGSEEFINCAPRVCVWVEDNKKNEAQAIRHLALRFENVKSFREGSKAKETRPAASYPHRFRQIQGSPGKPSTVVPIHSSESRSYLPVGILPAGGIVSNAAYALYNAPLWNMAVIASRIHLVWIATVCGKLETRYRYSNTLGWNTFPVPALTDQNKADLTTCAENILLAREAHFPATIADLYDPDTMPANLREAHDRNDDTLEHIYIGRRFRNDTERLEKLFELYSTMIAATKQGAREDAKTRRRRDA